jgi:hypothetical protein
MKKGVLQKVATEVAINSETAVTPTRLFHSPLTVLRELQPEYWSCVNRFRVLDDTHALPDDRNCEVQLDQLRSSTYCEVVPMSINLHLRTIAAAIQTVHPQLVTLNAESSHLYLYEMYGAVAILQRAFLTAIQIFSRFSLASQLSMIGIH